MATAYRCARRQCRTLWSENHVEEWGRTRESQGYGPQPVCTNLLDNDRGDKGVCRGQLIAIETDDETRGVTRL